MNPIEFKAAGLLLDVGVAVPLRRLNYLQNKKTRHVVMHTPTQGGLIRIARKYLSMNVNYEAIKNYTFEQNMEFIARHGKLVSEMVAYTLVRGYLSGILFCKPVAWWLRHRVHPLMLQEAWFQMLSLLDIDSFRIIIKSARILNPMKPRLSQQKKGS